MVICDWKFEFTGALAPDSTGYYQDDGLFNGKMSYYLVGNGWFLWWDNVSKWIVSQVKGVLGAAYWGRLAPTIPGLYTPQLGAAGLGTMAEI